MTIVALVRPGAEPLIAPEPHEQLDARRPHHRDRPARRPARARRAGGGLMEASLVALGGALLVAGLLGRFGPARRGCRPSPCSSWRASRSGPHTPGHLARRLARRARPARDLRARDAAVPPRARVLGPRPPRRRPPPRDRRRRVPRARTSLAGAVLGFAFGWGDREALVIAGAVAISSSAIVTKLLTELRRLGNRETPLILGIIVVEDVFLALYLAVVQPILSDASGTRDPRLDRLRVRVPHRLRAHRPLRVRARAPAARRGERRAPDRVRRRPRGPRRGRRRGGRRLRRDRRAARRSRRRGDRPDPPGRAPGAPDSATRSARSSSSSSASASSRT